VCVCVFVCVHTKVLSGLTDRDYAHTRIHPPPSTHTHTGAQWTDGAGHDADAALLQSSFQAQLT